MIIYYIPSFDGKQEKEDESMRMKHWGMLSAAGFLILLAAAELAGFFSFPRMLRRAMAILGVVLLFGGMIGVIWYDARYPAFRCPQCKKGLRLRHLRKPDGGSRMWSGGSAVKCPYCGAIFHLDSVGCDSR